MKQFRMTGRDAEILLSVYKHRFLTVQQIQRLHFPSMQTAYRRVRLLWEQGMLATFTIPNIEEAVVTIGRRGLEEVGGLLGVEKTDLRWTETKAKPRDYYFMRHFLAINDFRIGLALECEVSGLTLLGFIPDYLGHKTSKGGVLKYIKDIVCDIDSSREEISHTPDGVFALQREDRSALFFLEIDRGTEGISDPNKGVLKALRFYASYLLGGKYGRYATDFNVPEFRGFRTLFVTTSRARIDNIRQIVTGLQVPQKVKRFIWLTTFEAIADSGILAPIWVSSDSSDSHQYRIG